MGACNPITNTMKSLNLDCIRESLIRQEDTIIFSLIERSKFPINSPVYSPSLASTLPSSKSLLHFIVHQSEAIQSQVIILTHFILICFVCIFFLGFYCFLDFLGNLLSWVLLVMINILFMFVLCKISLVGFV